MQWQREGTWMGGRAGGKDDRYHLQHENRFNTHHKSHQQQ